MKIRGSLSFFLLSLGLAVSAGASTPEEEAQAKVNLEIALSSAAKRLCSSVFVSGRTLEHVLSEELDNPALAGVEYDVGENQVVTSAGGMKATAVHRGPLGCTLLKDKTADALRNGLDSSEIFSLGDDDQEWPLGNRVTLPKSVPGLDLQAVNAAVDKAFEDMEPGQNVRTRAVLVAHQGKIIAERYAKPFHADMPQLGWSMTKTVTGTLTAMMAEDGFFELQEPAPVPMWQGDDDPRSAITLENLLHMSSGLRFSEVYTAGSLSDVILMLYTTGDTGGFAMDQALEHPPGTHWSYSSGTSNIIARIQREQFDEHIDYVNYPRERLFGKLGMTSAVMELDESGVYVGSSYMYATPRDWAKMGQLYLQDGLWDGERILPEGGWVDYATTPAKAAPKGNYGAQIWLNAGSGPNPEDRPMPSLPASLYYLSGFEGQNVVVIPEHELVVVRMGLTTSGPRPIWELAEAVLAAFH